MSWLRTDLDGLFFGAETTRDSVAERELGARVGRHYSFGIDSDVSHNKFFRQSLGGQHTGPRFGRAAATRGRQSPNPSAFSAELRCS